MSPRANTKHCLGVGDREILTCCVKRESFFHVLVQGALWLNDRQQASSTCWDATGMRADDRHVVEVS
jgi:hypothetical protein